MSERNDGNEGNDDGPHAPAPDQRSVEDIFKAFEDGMGDSRDKVIGEEGDEKEKEDGGKGKETAEETEKNRRAALDAAGVTHALNTPERETEIMKEVFRSTKSKDEDDK